MMAEDYVFEEGMAEISGFGGGYEAACQRMIVAGMKWFDENPDADPHFRGYENVYGIICDENEDAKALSKAVMGAVEDCTGAMHQATIGHILRAHQRGWDAYVIEMKALRIQRELEAESDEENTTTTTTAGTTTAAIEKEET